MARETVTREIGPNSYRVTQLRVKTANRVITRIIKVVGPAFGDAVDNIGEKDPAKQAFGDLSKKGVRDALGSFVAGLGDDDLNWLVGELRPGIAYQTPEMKETNGEAFVPMSESVWDDVFSGAHLLDQFKVLLFALEVNFGAFLGGAAGLKGAFAKFTTPAGQA